MALARFVLTGLRTRCRALRLGIRRLSSSLRLTACLTTNDEPRTRGIRSLSSLTSLTSPTRLLCHIHRQPHDERVSLPPATSWFASRGFRGIWVGIERFLAECSRLVSVITLKVTPCTSRSFCLARDVQRSGTKAHQNSNPCRTLSAHLLRIARFLAECSRLASSPKLKSLPHFIGSPLTHCAIFRILCAACLMVSSPHGRFSHTIWLG